MKKIFFASVFLTITFLIFPLVLSEKILVSRKLREVAELIESKKFNEAKSVLQKIKEAYPESEFRVISNFFLGKICALNNDYYRASFFLELATGDPFIDRLVTFYKYDIYYTAGVALYKTEDYDKALDYFNRCIEKDFVNKDSSLLFLSEIYARKKNEPGRASIYYLKIDRKKLTSEEREKYNFLSNHILWDKIDTSKIGYKDPNVSSLSLDKDIIYIGLYNGGLIEYNYIFDTYDYYVGGNLASENVRDIYADGRFIYIGTSDGLSIFDKRNGSFSIVEDFKGVSINCISGNEDFIWFGTLGKGIIAFDKKNKNYFQIGDCVNISALFWDDQTLYVAPYGGRLFCYIDGNIFQANINIPSKNPVTGILRHKDALFFTSYGGGVYRYDLKNKTLKNFSKENGHFNESYFLCLSQRNDILYCGSLGNGVYSYDINNDKWERFFISDLYMGTDIRKIVFNDNYMFIATLGEGVLRRIIVESEP